MLTCEHITVQVQEFADYWEVKNIYCSVCKRYVTDRKEPHDLPQL